MDSVTITEDKAVVTVNTEQPNTTSYLNPVPSTTGNLWPSSIPKEGANSLWHLDLITPCNQTRPSPSRPSVHYAPGEPYTPRQSAIPVE